MTLRLFPLSFVGNFNDLRLDIVGIVAVLGEGCTSRIVQASGLNYHHALPRLLPAPQALLRYERRTSLPTSQGMVIGVYSGNFSSHLNFFCQLLHPDELEPNTVKVFRVDRRPNARSYGGQAFGVHPRSLLTLLSLVGFVFWLLLIGLAIPYRDGFALIATILLGFTSSLVGVASWWSLEFHENAPQKALEHAIPPSDVVIHYPSGAFRIIRCPEYIARLYFKTDICTPTVGDSLYRFLALVASICLMIGLLCMGNAQTSMQIAFAGAYIILNILYWGVSALDPMVWHWRHGYTVEEIKFYEPGTGPDSSMIAQNDPSKDKPVSISAAGPHRMPPSPSPRLSPGILPADVSVQVKLDGTRQSPRKREAFLTEQHEMDVRNSLISSPRTFTQLECGDHEAAQRPSLRTRLSRRTSGIVSTMKLQRTNTLRSKPPEKRFTETLWTVIALTGGSKWIENHQIVPETDVWRNWLAEANRMARPLRSQGRDNKGKIVSACKVDSNGIIVLPIWNFKGAFKSLLQTQDALDKNRPPDPTPFAHLTMANTSIGPVAKERLLRWASDARIRLKDGRRATPIRHILDISLRSRFGRAEVVRSPAS